MLSENLAALRESLAKYQDAEALATICAVLLSCEEDARAMERGRISPEAMAPDVLLDNVAPISQPRADTQGGVA